MRSISSYAIAVTGAAVLLHAATALAQEGGVSSKPRSVEQIVQDARSRNPALKVRVDPVTGLPVKVRGLRPSVDPEVTLGASRDASGQPSDDDIINTTEAFFRSGELSAAFATANDRSKVVALRVRRDPDFKGQSIVHVEQRVDGIPVFGSSGRVHVSPSLAVTQFTTTFSLVDVGSTTPSITKDRAIATARERLRELLATDKDRKSLDRLRAGLDTATAGAELVIYDPTLVRGRKAAARAKQTTRLSWLTSIDQFRFFVDAETGEVLYFHSDQPWMMPRQVYDLNRGFVFPGVKLVDDVSGERQDPLPDDASNAYLNTGRVGEFYARNFGRTGILELGETEMLSAYVQYGESTNAYWCTGQTFDCPGSGAMVYGASTPAALDVVGHEMTHGVISAEADLTYADEAGAVNESLADILGTLIEFQENPGEANWVLGEKIPGYARTSAIRNMANPNMMDVDGNSLFNRNKPYAPGNRGQPDHYDDYVTREDPICETTNDYFTGCVHFNSGIFNKFAFLVSEGGRHRGLVVNGIGRSKLGRIAYRALVAHLTPSSGLQDSAGAFEDACRELVAVDGSGMDSGDCDRVREAQSAVGLAFAGS